MAIDSTFGIPVELINDLSAVNGFSGQIEDYLERWRDILDPVFYDKLLKYGQGIRDLESEIFGEGGGWLEYALHNRTSK